VGDSGQVTIKEVEFLDIVAGIDLNQEIVREIEAVNLFVSNLHRRTGSYKTRRLDFLQFPRAARGGDRQLRGGIRV
jgi:hypothetical protein